MTSALSGTEERPLLDTEERPGTEGHCIPLLDTEQIPMRGETSALSGTEERPLLDV